MMHTNNIGAYAMQALTDQEVTMGHNAPHARLCREVHETATEVRSTVLTIHDIMEQAMRAGQHSLLRQATSDCWDIVNEMDAVLEALPRVEGESKPHTT